MLGRLLPLNLRRRSRGRESVDALRSACPSRCILLLIIILIIILIQVLQRVATAIRIKIRIRIRIRIAGSKGSWAQGASAVDVEASHESPIPSGYHFA